MLNIYYKWRYSPPLIEKLKKYQGVIYEEIGLGVVNAMAVAKISLK